MWNGCDRSARIRGYCNRCYQRAIKQGLITPTPNTGRSRVLGTGYIRTWAPTHPLAKQDGYVLEHRMVAWDAGLFTDPSLHVHHINGDKTDNRPENLQPMGESDHHVHHVSDGSLITNQHGTYPRKPQFCSACNNPAFRGDLCSMHSSRMLRYGTLDPPTRAEKMRRRALKGVDTSELVRRFLEGQHPTEIARITTIHPGTVNKVLQEHGYALRAGRPPVAPRCSVEGCNERLSRALNATTCPAHRPAPPPKPKREKKQYRVDPNPDSDRCARGCGRKKKRHNGGLCNTCDRVERLGGITCSIDGCEKQSFSKSLCQMHYAR